MRIRIEGRDLPQSSELRLNNVHVGVQRRAEVVGRVPVTEAHAVWELEADGREVDDLLDVGGPWVHGRPGARFLYLSWGAVHDGEFAMFRRAKLLFGDIPSALLRAAFSGGGVLVGRLSLTDDEGGPRCARVRPPEIVWTLEADR
ncbi:MULTISPECIES: DUF5990 family protein [Actinoplanes]|uniref:Monooxygenase n=2 Tax=Actinoplanes TaxID=1865 RepID=A0A117MNN7_9ACTN|nr:MULTISPECIES: DUF5990 family protein [Actinoplanes]KUL27416.1 hypothetical protein ADL15_35645 [Actinoplanes awajinensis subsp. mycoplanecinus]GIE70460.1 hypothetical protein Apa02nite_065680 [Actinoplanes palleronii]